PEIEAESAYWLGLPWSRVARLPRDVPDGENSGRTRRVASLALGGEETRRLLEDLPQSLGAAIEEILLAAVAWSLAEWPGNPVPLLQRAGHGRTPPFPALDIARTVGWFAAAHPAVLDLAGAADPRQALAAVAAQARAVPREGFGYGLLRYLCPNPHL